MNSSTKSCLSGVRVLDLTRVFAGPWCTQSLADLGAEVVKIERPGAGDDSRRLGPPFWTDHEAAGGAKSAFYLSANRNKKSVALDISTPQGQEVIRRLCAQVDVVVENYKVGTLARYGLDYASLREINPRLVYCSITGFGQTGPLKHRPGYDAIFQAMSGLMSMTGEPDGAPGAGPQRIQLVVSDLMTGMYATQGILAALHYRDCHSGVGQHIDIALLDAQIAALSHAAMAYLVSGQPPVRHGTAAPTGAPSQRYECADRPIMLVVGNNEQFTRLCKVLSVPELATDERYRENVLRVRHLPALNAVIAPLLLTRPAQHWIDALDPVGVPCGLINSMDEVFAHPQVRAREMQRTFEGVANSPPTLANPLRFSETPVRYDLPPPALGEHTDQVLSSWLAMTPSEIAALSDAGAAA
ncbi:MAG: CoA transferase [Proteobacteria bacterium]|nr:CoA transferase [Pseudomonadota bacterium]